MSDMNDCVKKYFLSHCHLDRGGERDLHLPCMKTTSFLQVCYSRWKRTKYMTVPCWFYIPFLNWILLVMINGAGCTKHHQVLWLACHMRRSLWSAACEALAGFIEEQGQIGHRQTWSQLQYLMVFCTSSPSNPHSWNLVAKSKTNQWGILKMKSLM